ncbi:Germination protease protein [Marine Group I thaumarchaeote SCGC AAA799-O18]|nr:Germination protease protein [Marine Group I thaumarchaeote SCGC AAA799-O18]
MDFSNLDILDEFFGTGDSSPIMMLVWIIPIILFVFYGQRIQLIITSGDIKKKLAELEQFRNDSRNELIQYVKKNLAAKDNVTQKFDRFFDYFTVMPVDIDPNGIIPKIHRLIRSREDTTRKQIQSLFSEIDTMEITKIQNLLEVVTYLQLLHRIVRHLFLTAKKQNNYPMILPLQMMLPFIMEQAEALKDAVPAFKQGQPIGDGIGPLVVGEMMLGTKKQKAEFETVYSESKFKDRKLILLKAEGPYATVGRPSEAAQVLVEQYKPDIIVMIDAALKLEGEDSGTVSQGFGAAIGGIGTDRFKIEELATKFDIPIFSIVVKQSVKDAVTLMKKEIANQAENVKNQVHEMITDNTNSGQTVLVIGVGNTLGVSQ